LEIDYWRRRWREGRIGFHQSEVHRHLMHFLEEHAGTISREILVPLCGKSHDLIWLRDQGHRVTGVEFAPEACRAFLAENELEAKAVVEGAFKVWRFPGLTLHNGDFFQFERDDFDIVWDRAALIALPAETRPQYTEHLVDRLLERGKILLVTVDYERSEMDGPPFAVPNQEVHDLFQGYQVDLLLEESQDALGAERFGLSWLKQRVHLITI
jgi:thiopurine S-methyltransferase